MSKQGIVISQIANASSLPSSPQTFDMAAVMAQGQTFALYQYINSWGIVSTPVFTDDILMPYVTEIKKAHIQELRNYTKYLATVSANKYGDTYHNIHDFSSATSLLAPTITLNETVPGSGTYTFTGTSNSNNVATTAFVANVVASIIGTTPGVLNTLTKIDTALNNDAALNTTLVNSIATKVASVSVTAPITTTGGTTPNIAIPKASSDTNGYLSAEDWVAFNGKQGSGNYVSTGTKVNGHALSGDITLTNADIGSQPNLISGTNIKTFNGEPLLGSGDITLAFKTVGGTNITGNGDIPFPTISYTAPTVQHIFTSLSTYRSTVNDFWVVCIGGGGGGGGGFSDRPSPDWWGYGGGGGGAGGIGITKISAPINTQFLIACGASGSPQGRGYINDGGSPDHTGGTGGYSAVFSPAGETLCVGYGGVGGTSKYYDNSGTYAGDIGGGIGGVGAGGTTFMSLAIRSIQGSSGGQGQERNSGYAIVQQATGGGTNPNVLTSVGPVVSPGAAGNVSNGAAIGWGAGGNGALGPEWNADAVGGGAGGWVFTGWDTCTGYSSARMASGFTSGASGKGADGCVLILF